MTTIRPASVAGLFYPQESEVLQGWLQKALTKEASEQSDSAAIPRAIIVPHAGYAYSGETAAKGFELWRHAGEKIKTVVVIGPAHRVGFHGMTTVDFDALETPLGPLKVNTQLRDQLLQRFDFFKVHNMAHAPEHSLEVELPFLKYLLPNVQVLPLLNGSISAPEVAQLLQSLWQHNDVYFVISSDLSHFLDYDTANQIDNETAQLIESRNWHSLNGERACGYKGIQGLLAMLEGETVHIERLERINSGDTAGDKSRVVGYGAWALYQDKKEVNQDA